MPKITTEPFRQLRNVIRLCHVVCLLCLSGCVTYSDVVNLPKTARSASEKYSIINSQRAVKGGDTAVLLAFSGGGTRAAALTYGVMKTLRDTPVSDNHGPRRLLDDVRGISAVSGGSFTAAYYGLNGDEMFETFETDFLHLDVAGALFRNLWNPLHWFTRRGRTDYATDFYDENVFKGATFADLQRQGGPMILINASDLGRGVHFSFVQEHFDLLCSDLSRFPVARAVAASSAVPLVFHPVVLRRYGNCSQYPTQFSVSLTERAQLDAELSLVLDDLEAYQDSDIDEYIHLVDGGITDNLGLRAIYEVSAVSGGAKALFQLLQRDPPKRIVVISVNAAIKQHFSMNHSNRRPSVEETILAVSDLQLRRYNATTLNLIHRLLTSWTEDLSTENRPVESWFIELDFNDVASESERDALNAIPTSMSLSDSEVEHLVEAGQQILKSDESFQDLLRAMNP